MLKGKKRKEEDLFSIDSKSIKKLEKLLDCLINAKVMFWP